MSKITDRQLTTILDTTNLKAGIGKSRDEEGGVRVRSGSPGIAWLKSKFSTTAQKQNIQARENFVARVSKDLGLTSALAKRLHNEIVGTHTVTGVKKMPLTVGKAQDAIKLIMELARNVRDNVDYDPMSRFQKQLAREGVGNQQNVPVMPEPKKIEVQEEIGLDELLDDEPVTDKDRPSLSDPELQDVLGMLAQGTEKTERTEHTPSGLQSDLALLDTLDEMLDDMDRKTDKPTGGGQKPGTIDENALFSDLDGLVDEIGKKQDN
ncbi:hypothetical protein [Aquibium microcysteis]|uniref:hypothetical protein n=1 Tax=Aquibium microcysteis TaxID=675281 RepID=UPI00165CFC16|nr:hypothetical protein [Aquibium microcysteis]